MEFFIMARIKSGKPVRSDRLLMILANGGKVTLQEIENTMDYHNMYRISCEVYCIKLNGGVVKTHKDGRKVVGYELINTQEMIDKMLTPKGFSVMPIVGRDNGVQSLSDLNAKPVKATKASKPVKTESLEVEEVTE